MNTEFTISARTVRRLFSLLIAAVLLIASAPFAQPNHASAAQFTNRSIELNDASPSGTSITSGVGSGTNVTYKLTFTPASNASSMVIDFCANDAIIADNCTTTSFGLNASSAAMTNVSGTLCGTGWTIVASTYQLILKRTGGTSTNDIQQSVVQSCEFSGITNPTSAGTFYARMYTYGTADPTAAPSNYVDPTTLGTYADYGAVALAITNTITITARVQEQLTFCVSAAAVTDCTSATTPALILGHGTPTKILDSSQIDTGNVYTLLSTNATSGAIIRLRTNNLTCGGLSADAGATCALPAQGTVTGNNTTPAVMPAATAAFGLFVDNSTLAVGNSVGTVTASSNYHDATCNGGAGATIATPTGLCYGMNNDTTPTGNGVTSSYGTVLATTPSPVYKVANAYVFAAAASLTTPAGIYTANMSMICTATF